MIEREGERESEEGERWQSNKRSRNYENSMKIANKFSRCCQASPNSLELPELPQFVPRVYFLWLRAAVRCNNYTSERTGTTATITTAAGEKNNPQSYKT